VTISLTCSRFSSWGQAPVCCRSCRCCRAAPCWKPAQAARRPNTCSSWVKEGHLRWDSLGEYCALAPSLELMATNSGNARAALLSKTLDEAIGQYLEDARYPAQKVNEIDNRGSTYYLALAWAKALAAQDEDGELKRRFTPVAAALAAAEGKITQELLAAQGKPVTSGGTICRTKLSVSQRCGPALH